MFFFTYLSIYLFIKLFNDFFIHLLIFYIYTLCKRGIQLFIFMQLFTCKFIHLFDYLFISSKIVSMYKKLFVDSFINLFKHLNIYSFIYLSIHLIINLSIHIILNSLVFRRNNLWGMRLCVLQSVLQNISLQRPKKKT